MVDGDCRALSPPADGKGDQTGTLELLERALAGHQRLPMPVEEARTRLLLGTVEQRLAGLVTTGQANREVAAAMLVSVGPSSAIWVGSTLFARTSLRRAHSCAGFGRLSVARWASRKACSTGFAVRARAVA